MSKVLVIGLDSASPDLFFDRYLHEMPVLEGLVKTGAFGPLLSTNPPITVPAWSSMMASKDPGQLGFYGFRNRKDYSYEAYQFANSALVKDNRLWDILGRAGKRSILVGVPQTYPPPAVNGEVVSCFLTPSTRSRYTHPAELKEEVERVSGGYVLDVENFRTDDKEGLLERVYVKTRKHFSVAKHLIAHHPWDYFMAVEMGVDRIHHGFWSFMDPLHHKHEAGNPFKDAIRDYYRYIDSELGELVALAPRGTTVLVVSDHGSKRMQGGICFNEWLIREGYLTLKTAPKRPTPIGKVQIDWKRTKAWGDGGYYGRLFMNVRGREPEGVVDPGDYERVREDLIAGIAEITDPQGRNIGSRAFRPEEIYRSVSGVAPDLIVYFGDLDWRSVGAVGVGAIHTFENDTGPDEANHDWHGIVVLASTNGSVPLAGRIEGAEIYDIAPTVLDIMGVEIPEDMIGKSLIARR